MLYARHLSLDTERENTIMAKNDYKRLQPMKPKKPTIVTSVRFPKPFAQTLQKLAAQDHRSLNSMIISLLDEAMRARAQASKQSADSTSDDSLSPAAQVRA